MNILNIYPIFKRKQFLTAKTRANYVLLRYRRVTTRIYCITLIVTYVHLIQLFNSSCSIQKHYANELRATLEIFQKTRLKYNSEVWEHITISTYREGFHAEIHCSIFGVPCHVSREVVTPWVPKPHYSKVTQQI